MTTIEAPTEVLFRMQVPVSELRFADDGNTLEGYAALFDEPTRIDSWEGRFDEIIAPGAFKRTIKSRGDQVKVLFDHGMDARFGGAPIAVLQVIREDDKGLFMEARFVDTEPGREAKELIRAGAVTGMSFRFSVINDEWDHEPDTPVRTLREVKLFELGPVTFPAYEATTVGVRNSQMYQEWLSNRSLGAGWVTTGNGNWTFENDTVRGEILELPDPAESTPTVPPADPPDSTRPSLLPAKARRKAKQLHNYLKEI